MSLSSILRANYLIPLSLSLRRPRARAIGVQKRETDTGEDRGFFCLFCFLRSLYSNRQRDVIYIKENLCCCWGKTLDCVTRWCAFCSLVFLFLSGLSLSLRICIRLKRESAMRACVLYIVLAFHRFQRVSLVLSLSVLFLVKVCSLEGSRESIRWRHRWEEEREQ